MAEANPRFAIRRVNLTMALSAITAPILCNYVSIKCVSGVDLIVQSDNADTQTQDLIPNGSFELITSSYQGPTSPRYRYKPGEVVMYLATVSGVATVVVRYVC